MFETAAANARTRTYKRAGLIVSTVAWDRDRYTGNFYDVAKHLIVRLLWGLAEELREYNVATVALAPGFMRTERVMKPDGTASPSLLFKGIHCRNLLNPGRTQVFDFILVAQRTNTSLHLPGHRSARLIRWHLKANRRR